MRNMGRSLFCLLVLFLFILAVTPVRANESYVMENYEWRFSNQNWWLTINISQERLDAYKSFSVDKRRNYGYMITTEDEALIEVANEFTNVSANKGYDANTEANFVLTFIQSLDYTSDKDTTGYDEYPRFPLETLAARGGDCEDMSVLYATLMILMGYDAVLFLKPGDVENPGHMAVGIAGDGLRGSYIAKDGIKYYYAETTGRDWKIGDIPPEYSKDAFVIVEFTGDQYDPMSEEDRENVVVEFWREHPTLFLLVSAVLIIIMVLIFQIIHEGRRTSTKESSSLRHRNGKWGARHPKESEVHNVTHGEHHNDLFVDKYAWEKSSLRYGREAISPRWRSDLLISWESRCPHCSSVLRYDPGNDDWWCERCDNEWDDYGRKYYERRINKRKRKIYEY